MSAVPDYALGTTVYVQFTTRRFTTGVPYTLAGTPAISVLEQNNATPITAGITLNTDRASVTGLNEVAIVASGANGYEAGKEYAAYISTGTVDSVSVVGEVIGRFSIEKQSALRPTTAGNTLDVSATGEAGMDFDNIKQAASPTTLTNITVPTTTTLTNAPSDSSGVTTLLSRIASALTITTGKVDVNDKTGFALSSAGIQAIWDALTSALTTVGSIGKRLADNVDAAITSRLASGNVTVGGYAAGQTPADSVLVTPANKLATDAGGAVTAGTVSDKTGYALTAAYDAAKTAAQAGDAMALTVAERNSAADALLGRNVAGGSSAGRLVKESLYVLRNKTAIAGGTLTVYQTDDTTAAFTATVSTAAGDNIATIDPA